MTILLVSATVVWNVHAPYLRSPRRNYPTTDVARILTASLSFGQCRGCEYVSSETQSSPQPGAHVRPDRAEIQLLLQVFPTIPVNLPGRGELLQIFSRRSSKFFVRWRQQEDDPVDALSNSCCFRAVGVRGWLRGFRFSLPRQIPLSRHINQLSEPPRDPPPREPWLWFASIAVKDSTHGYRRRTALRRLM